MADWKTLILVVLFHNSIVALPTDMCCTFNSAPSPLDMDNSRISIANRAASLILHNAQKTESSRLRRPADRMGTEESVVLAVENEMEEVKPAILLRNKRFPIHLDPLYQYRYLARSGQCPTAEDGQPEFYCPTPDKTGNWRCIDDFQLCDGVRHCPNGEDELPVSCLFYRVVESHLHSVSQRLNSDKNLQHTSL